MTTMEGHNNHQTPYVSNETGSEKPCTRPDETADTHAGAVSGSGADLMPQALTRGSRIGILRSLPRAQRWEYFKDQLLKRCLAILAALCIVVFLLIHILTPSPAPKLYVAIIDNALSSSQSDELQRISAAALHLSPSRKGGVMVSSRFDLRQDGLSALQTMLSNHEIDIVIADRSSFSQLSGYGYFAPLSSKLRTNSQSADLSKDYVNFHGFDSSEHKDAFYDSSGKGVQRPYGLNISNLAQWKEIAPQQHKQDILGIAQNTRNSASVQSFVDFLCSP
ncbi:hypothetical protein [Bifidobacterium aquikefiri]